MSFLLDTNVLSEWQRPAGDPGVKAWMTATPDDLLFISVLAVGEIRRGAELLRRRDPTRATTYDRWLAQLQLDYGDHVLPITARIADAWGRMGVPNPLPIVDGLMAATARIHGLTIVTRNVGHFESAGVPVLNPFSVRS